ncbi:hypothetical protein CF326_g8992 [Tilletia indica]|nr:hypothetical protein CF326_g8992 [Tilletia indica]
MLTFIKFSPLDSTHSSFSFLLHPHLKRSNIVDDTLLDLDFFLDDEARVQLWGDSPSIWSSRFDVGIYINHQLLRSDPVPLRDGDVLAFPRRRHDLKTAVRFRVEVETLELSCGVGLELEMVRMMAQEMREEAERGADDGTSSTTTLSDNAAINTFAPPTFSYAALTASHPPNKSAGPLHDMSRSDDIAALHSSSLTSTPISPSSPTSPLTSVLSPPSPQVPSISPPITASPHPVTSSPPTCSSASVAPSPTNESTFAAASHTSASSPCLRLPVLPASNATAGAFSPCITGLTVALDRFRQGWLAARRALLELESGVGPSSAVVSPRSCTSTTSTPARSKIAAIERVQVALLALLSAPPRPPSTSILHFHHARPTALSDPVTVPDTASADSRPTSTTKSMISSPCVDATPSSAVGTSSLSLQTPSSPASLSSPMVMHLAGRCADLSPPSFPANPASFFFTPPVPVPTCAHHLVSRLFALCEQLRSIITASPPHHHRHAAAPYLPTLRCGPCG